MAKQVNTGLATFKQYAALHGKDLRTVYNWIKDPKKKIKVVKIGAHSFIKVGKKELSKVLK